MLRVHRAERADTLADVLAERLAVPPADPMRPEIVAVPEHGVERWLRQRLAVRLGESAPGAGDGIAANIDFATPTALLRQVVVDLADEPEAAAAWYTDRLRWPVLQVIDAQLADQRLEVLRNHLTGADRHGRRLAAADTIAGLLHGYGWQRPDMIAAWAAGRDEDGTGRPLGETMRWQPWLWRLVREQVGQPHLAENLAQLTARLRAEPAAVALPERLALFGPTRIPQALREVLAALAAHREVDLYLPHPSDALWQSIAADPQPPIAVRHPEGDSGSTRHRPRNGLLAALAGDVAELQQVLTPIVDDDRYHPGPAAAPTLLGALQESLRGDRPVTDCPPVPADRARDGSLEIHACHGPQRQVEVLRDRLLALLQDHDDLEPRDVLIMCPDVETYAPLIRGAFGQPGLSNPGYRLRVRLADRGLRETNAVLDVLAAVLALAGGRVRAGELLDLLAAAPVRARFGFTDDDLEKIGDWVPRSGIRWGMDAAGREAFGLGGFPQGTVATGLDRILLGVVADEDENQWLATALPLAGVGSTDTDLAGRFAEFAEGLSAVLTAAAGPHSAADWSALLIETIDLLTDTAPDDQWQRSQAVRMITGAFDGPAAGELPLERADVVQLLDGLLAARPTRSNFCTGELTVCTLTPMRSVPHRAVVLLGMDTGVFPRGSGRDGDDVLGRRPLVGERDRSREDRQVFLDAVGAATDHLLIFYTGADPVTGTRLPPAVVVSEVIDAAAGLLRHTGEGEPEVVHRHTLHAFDERNFRAGPGERPRSFDTSLLAGARTLAELSRSAPGSGARLPRLAQAALPAPAATDIELDDLIAFLVNPLEAFARQRLGVWIAEMQDGHADELAVSLDGLERWQVGDRYLSGLLAGRDPQAAQAAELRRGTLPPFALGNEEFGPIRSKAEAIALAAGQYRSGDADTVDVAVPLPDGRRVVGTLSEVYDGRLVAVGYSGLGAKHRVGAWVRLLAAAADSPAEVREALVVGSARGRRPAAAMSRLGVPEDPAGLLAALVAVRDAGLCAPIGLHLDAAEAAAASFTGGSDGRALNRARYKYSKSFADPYAGLVFADDPAVKPDFEALRKAMPAVADLGAAAPLLPGSDETEMFVRLAALLFGPLLHEESQR